MNKKEKNKDEGMVLMITYTPPGGRKRALEAAPPIIECRCCSVVVPHSPDNNVLFVTRYDLSANPLVWFKHESSGCSGVERFGELRTELNSRMKGWADERLRRLCEMCRKKLSSTNLLQSKCLEKSEEALLYDLKRFLDVPYNPHGPTKVFFFLNEDLARIRVSQR